MPVTGLAAFKTALREEARRPAEIVTDAQRIMAEFIAYRMSAARATWSPEQPNDYWSGQYRQSVRVSIGSPDPSYAPDNPGDWPIHGSPYPAADPVMLMGELHFLRPYQVVWVSNASPHADEVERNAAPVRQTYMAAQSMFANYPWSWGARNQTSDPPF